MIIRIFWEGRSNGIHSVMTGHWCVTIIENWQLCWLFYGKLITFVPSSSLCGHCRDSDPHLCLSHAYSFSASLRSVPANVHSIVQPESSVRRKDLILEFHLALISSNLKTPTTFLKPRGFLLRDRWLINGPFLIPCKSSGMQYKRNEEKGKWMTFPVLFSNGKD